MDTHIITGDCLDMLRTLPDNSVDSIVTDPPYGLSNTSPDKIADTLTAWATGDDTVVPGGKGFMGKDWDGFVPPPAVWKECMRVLKPGGHMAVFAGARTQDLMGLSIRLAGFEIRDTLGWIYGSGFPKSMNVSKAIDNLAPPSLELSEDEVRFCQWMRDESGLSESDCRRLFTSARFLTGEVEVLNTATKDNPRLGRRAMVPTAVAWEAALPELPEVPEWVSDLVKSPPKPPMQTPGEWKSGKGQGTTGTNEWAGWGTALKPAIEPIILARKPLVGTVAANVLAHGVGGLNIDACRVQTDDQLSFGNRHIGIGAGIYGAQEPKGEGVQNPAGRFPANVLLDEHAAAEMDKQSGISKSNVRPATGKDDRGTPNTESSIVMRRLDNTKRGHSDIGGASRFFPVFTIRETSICATSTETAMTPTATTAQAVKGAASIEGSTAPNVDGSGESIASCFKYQAKAPKKERPVVEREDGTKIQHPTVKPVALMEWLVTLITPTGGTVLDPFAGSGSTLEAAQNKDFSAIGIEREPDYIQLIEQRLTHHTIF